MKRVGIQNQKVVGTWVEEVNLKVEITYHEFDKFKREVRICKVNLTYLPKIWNSMKRVEILNKKVVKR